MIRYEGLSGATVCVCAPTRSAADVAQLELRLGVAGASVFTPVPYSASVSSVDRAALAVLHLRKIAASDVVVVANSGGYAGSGTASEIAYALRLGKPVLFLNDPGTLEVGVEAYDALIGRRAFLDLRPTAFVPHDVVIGSIVNVRVSEDPTGRAAWFRINDSRRFATRAQALEAYDPGRVMPDAERVTQALEEKYPGTAPGEHTVLELDFIAELTAGELPEHTGPGARVVLLVRADEKRFVLVGPEHGPGLPGGEIAHGEYPSDAAARYACNQLGLAEPPPLRLVVLDTGANGPAGLAATFVFDTGILKEEYCDTLRTSAHALIGGCMLAPPDEALALVDRRAARWLQAASIAQKAHDELAPGAYGSHTVDARGRVVFFGFVEIDGPLLRLEDGDVPGARLVWEWREELPEGVPVTQAGVWASDRDGRVLLQDRVEQGRFVLPAGHPEPGDRDLLATAARGAFEESQVLIDQRGAAFLGYQVTYGDPAFPNGQAQARFATGVLAYYAIGSNTDSKLEVRRRPYRRHLVDIRHAAALLGWGPHADIQARAAEQGARVLGLPVDRPAADGYRDQGDPYLPAHAPDWNLEL